MRVTDLYQEAVKRLTTADIPDAELEVSFLLGHLLGFNRTQLLLAGDQFLSKELTDKFEQILFRRLQREPLAYILGQQEFWSLPFSVTPDVLIPRPETELLIEIALKTVKKENGFKGSILELGTGSGIIAIVLALELPVAKVYSIDRSFVALQVAASNVRQHDVAGRVRLINSNWLDPVKFSPRFDLVISNPPYVAVEELPSLQPEVRCFEPHLALDGGRAGGEVIKTMTQQLSKILKPNGWFFMEIGFDQEDYVLNLFDSYGGYDNLAVHKDYSGNPRVFQAKRKAS